MNVVLVGVGNGAAPVLIANAVGPGIVRVDREAVRAGLQRVGRVPVRIGGLGELCELDRAVVVVGRARDPLRGRAERLG